MILKRGRALLLSTLCLCAVVLVTALVASGPLSKFLDGETHYLVGQQEFAAPQPPRSAPKQGTSLESAPVLTEGKASSTEKAPASPAPLPAEEMAVSAGPGLSQPQDREQAQDQALAAIQQRLVTDQLPAPAPSAEPRKQEIYRFSGGTRFSAEEVENFKSPAAPADTATLTQRPLGQFPDRERFPQAESNPVKSTADAPVSTFSVDVDTASYAFVRNYLVNGLLPAPAAVRPEEMINYFDYAYPQPETREEPFSTNISVIDTPWNADTKLLQIGLQGYRVPLESLPQQHLVFLIDTSGSMGRPNKLPLLQQAFRLLVSTLRDQDTVAIVTYAGTAGVALEPTSIASSKAIIQAVNALRPGGRTAGHAGLREAYALADTMREEGGDARILLATDGDFNVGLSDISALKRYITNQAKSGIALSILGFGRSNYNDALMQTLAQNGNGVAAYIDSLAEARKVLVEGITGSVMTIAKDVKIQVEFNPATVAEYRLIGYETRALKREDFNNDKVDAGDIGAGHTVTALYEITPAGSPAVRLDTLRYQTGEQEPASGAGSGFEDELAFVKLRYKLPGESKSRLISTPVTLASLDIPAGESLFAASVAGFGQILNGSSYLGDWSTRDALDLADANRGSDTLGYRAEFVSLLKLASFAEN